jgi:hypothetical protein
LSKFIKSERILKKKEAKKKQLFIGKFVGVLTKGYMPIFVACYVSYSCPLSTTSGETFG